MTTALLKVLQQIIMAGKEYAISMKTLVALSRETGENENLKVIWACTRPMVTVNKLLLSVSERFPQLKVLFTFRFTRTLQDKLRAFQYQLDASQKELGRTIQKLYIYMINSKLISLLPAEER